MHLAEAPKRTQGDVTSAFLNNLAFTDMVLGEREDGDDGEA
jgi:hypothetical protein